MIRSPSSAFLFLQLADAVLVSRDDAREKRRLCVETLSEQTAITAERIRKFESGERSPYLDEFSSVSFAMS